MNSNRMVAVGFVVDSKKLFKIHGFALALFFGERVDNSLCPLAFLLVFEMYYHNMPLDLEQ